MVVATAGKAPVLYLMAAREKQRGYYNLHWSTNVLAAGNRCHPFQLWVYCPL